MKRVLKHLILFAIGGSIYILIETIYRHIMCRPPTHWSMFVLGGLAFLLIGELNEIFDWKMPFWMQDLIGTLITVSLECVFGYVLNIYLGLGIWDYSNLPFNLLGQICLPFALIWALLVAVAIVLDDYLRYWLFDENKPIYYWSFQK